MNVINEQVRLLDFEGGEVKGWLMYCWRPKIVRQPDVKIIREVRA